MLHRPAIILLLALVGVATAQPPSNDNPPQRVIFTERSPDSAIPAQLERLRFQPKEPAEDYALADESFIRWVPAEYNGSEPYGLLVWVSPSPRGEPRPDWLDVMARHKLIWIAANDAGNPRAVMHRFGLALDARHNMLAQYNIDPDRIYIGGMSGGSRVASRVSLIWGDLFNGGLMNDGVDFYTAIKVPDREDAFWRPTFHPPEARVLLKDRQQNRYVLVTGEHDANRAQTLATYHTGYKRIGFRHVTYFEVPGKGHAMIDAEWFEKAVNELDKPLTEPQPSPGPAADVAPEPPDESNNTEDDREATARELYQMGVNYLNAGRRDLAVSYLQKVITDYADTPYAEQAKEKLAQP